MAGPCWVTESPDLGQQLIGRWLCDLYLIKEGKVKASGKDLVFLRKMGGLSWSTAYPFAHAPPSAVDVDTMLGDAAASLWHRKETQLCKWRRERIWTFVGITELLPCLSISPSGLLVRHQATTSKSLLLLSYGCGIFQCYFQSTVL